MDVDIQYLNQAQRAEIDCVVKYANLDAKSADQFAFSTRTVDAASDAHFIPAGVVAKALGLAYETDNDRRNFKKRVLEKHPMFRDHWMTVKKSVLKEHLQLHEENMKSLGAQDMNRPTNLPVQELNRPTNLPVQELNRPNSTCLQIPVPGFGGQVHELKELDGNGALHVFMTPIFARFLLTRANDQLAAFYQRLWDHVRGMLRRGNLQQFAQQQQQQQQQYHQQHQQVNEEEQRLLLQRQEWLLTKAKVDTYVDTLVKLNDCRSKKLVRQLESKIAADLQLEESSRRPTRMDTDSDSAQAPAAGQTRLPFDLKLRDFMFNVLQRPAIVRNARVDVIKYGEIAGGDPLNGMYSKRRLLEIAKQNVDPSLTSVPFYNFIASCIPQFDCPKYKPVLEGKQERTAYLPNLEEARASFRAKYGTHYIF